MAESLEDMMRRAMEAQGKVNPDEVLAQAAALDLDEPTKYEAHEQRRIVEEATQPPLDASLCPSCEGTREVWNERAGRFLPCQACASEVQGQAEGYNLPASRAARDVAIHRVDAAAEEVFREEAYEAVLAAAERYPDGFIVDQVWEFYSGDYPREGRAMGPVMLRAQRAGVIVPTTTYRPSAKVSSHAVPRRVWRAS